MKTVVRMVAACAVMVGGALGVARADTTLRMSTFIPATHFLVANAVIPWTEEVAKVTQGRVKIALTPKIVGSPAGQFDVVRDGLADAALVVPGYTPGRFDLAGISEMPLLTDDTVVAAVAAERLYRKYLQETGLFKEVQVMGVFTGGGGHFFMKQKPIKTVADLKGLKIRAAVASTVPLLTELGTVPVQKASTEMYELLSSGVLDGSISGFDQVVPFKLADVAKHAVFVPGSLFNSTMLVAINKDAWSKISKADQDAIMKVSGEALSRAAGKSFVEPIQKGMQAMKAAGNTVDTASPEMVADMAKRFEPARRAMLDMAKKNGIKDPEEMWSWYQAEIKKLSEK